MSSYDVFSQKSECVQDEDPYCTAACPAGVDVRAILQRVARGDFDSAYALYKKRVLFPGIISRTCSRPCEQVCLRREMEGAVSIGLVEVACTKYARDKRRELYAVRKKTGRVAVVGGGVCGLACAVTLAGKGYTVALYEREGRLGGSLWERDRALLPAEVMEADISAATGDLDIDFRLNEPVPDWTALDADAVFLTVEGPGPAAADRDTLGTDREGCFAHIPETEPLLRVLQGKRAARSIDRFLQRMPLSSGAEEAARATRLFTPLPPEEPSAPPVLAQSPEGYSREEAVREAARCLKCECMACVKSCDFMRFYQRYPKHYINDAQQSLRTLKSLQAKLAARQTNSCNLCGLCRELCPNDVDMSEVYMHSRRIMLEYKNLPAAFHDFWLRDMAFSASDEAALCRPQRGFETCKYLFFPGCQMGGSDPRYITDAYGYLTDRLNGGVALELGCCAAPSEWAGYHDLTLEAAASFRERWGKLGKPVVILACPTCHKMFSRYHPDIEVRSLWRMIDDLGLPETAAKVGEVAVFDPCASRYDAASQSAVRSILRKLGARTEELPHRGRYAQCCGYGGLTYGANPSLTAQIVRSRAGQSETDYVTYCTNCRDAFSYAGKRAWHVLDLLFGGREADGGEGRVVTLSEKRANRRRLKRQLLHDIWGENMTPEQPRIRIQADDALKRKLDEALILMDDVEEVILHAERTGEKLQNGAGRFVAHKELGVITYWVEYGALDGGFLLYNAYCHRMKIQPVGGEQAL